MKQNSNKKGGFVALTSAVIVAVILIAITLSLSYTGFSARFNVIDLDHKERSFALAEACAEIAFLKIAADIEYSGDELIELEDSSCEILPATTDNNEITIRTRAAYPETGTRLAVTNLVAVLESPELDIVSWEEVPSH